MLAFLFCGILLEGWSVYYFLKNHGEIFMYFSFVSWQFFFFLMNVVHLLAHFATLVKFLPYSNLVYMLCQFIFKKSLFIKCVEFFSSSYYTRFLMQRFTTQSILFLCCSQRKTDFWKYGLTVILCVDVSPLFF